MERCGNMNATEKRRKELLEQMRRLYSDRREPPAVHPRYGSAYRKLYGSDSSEETSQSTFGIRLFLAALLFAAFITMKQQDYKIFKVDSQRIVKEIGTDLHVEERIREAWKDITK